MKYFFCKTKYTTNTTNRLINRTIKMTAKNIAIFIKRTELYQDKAFVTSVIQEVLQLGVVHDITFVPRVDDAQQHKYNAAIVTFKRWAQNQSTHALFHMMQTDDERTAKVFYNPKRYWYITEHCEDEAGEHRPELPLSFVPHELQTMSPQQLHEIIGSQATQLQHLATTNARLQKDNDDLRVLAEDPQFAEAHTAQALEDAQRRHAVAEMDAIGTQDQHDQQVFKLETQLADALDELKFVKHEHEIARLADEIAANGLQDQHEQQGLILEGVVRGVANLQTIIREREYDRLADQTAHQRQIDDSVAELRDIVREQDNVRVADHAEYQRQLADMQREAAISDRFIADLQDRIKRLDEQNATHSPTHADTNYGLRTENPFGALPADLERSVMRVEDLV